MLPLMIRKNKIRNKEIKTSIKLHYSSRCEGPLFIAKCKKSFDEESEYYTQVNMVTCRNRSSQLKFFIKSPEMLSNIAQMLS